MGTNPVALQPVQGPPLRISDVPYTDPAPMCAVAPSCDTWKRLEEGRKEERPPFAAGLAGGTTIDPGDCVAALMVATGLTMIQGGFITSETLVFSSGMSDKWEVAAAIVVRDISSPNGWLYIYGITHGHPKTFIGAWKRAWDTCGKPGKGLYDRTKARIVEALAPNPVQVPVPVPAGARMAAGVGPQLEDWQITQPGDLGLPFIHGAALMAPLIDGVPTLPTFHVAPFGEYPQLIEVF